MNRRTFLKGFALTAAGLWVPKAHARLGTMMMGGGVTAAPASGHSKSDANLMALWYFENNLNDSSGGGNNTLTGVATPAYVDTDVKQGTYKLSLTDATNNYAYITDANQVGLECTGNNWSFGGFFYMTANVYTIMMNKHGDGDYGWKISFNYTGPLLSFNYSTNGSDWNSVDSAVGSFNLNTWYHYVLTYDHTTLRLYTDGSESTTGDFPLTATFNINDTAKDFGIGYNDLNGQIATGYWDECFVFNDTLSGAEVLEIYNSGFGDR